MKINSAVEIDPYKTGSPVGIQFWKSMIGWICKELEFKTSKINSIDIRNTKLSGFFSGRAYCGRNSIGLRFNPHLREGHFPLVGTRGRVKWEMNNLAEVMVSIIAHEVTHLVHCERLGKYRFNLLPGVEREESATRKQVWVLQKYREQEQRLRDEWLAADNSAKTKSAERESKKTAPETLIGHLDSEARSQQAALALQDFAVKKTMAALRSAQTRLKTARKAAQKAKVTRATTVRKLRALEKKRTRIEATVSSDTAERLAAMPNPR